MINSLSGHVSAVTSIIEVNQKLISSSLDSSIKVWNTQIFQCERNISICTKCCDSNVFSLLDKNTLIVISDTQFGIINTNSFEICKTELDIEMKSIASLSNNSFVIGCREGGVFAYDIETYEVTDMQSKPHKGDVNEIINVDMNTFATAGGNTINIWEYKFI